MYATMTLFLFLPAITTAAAAAVVDVCWNSFIIHFRIIIVIS
jgi:hypothetical protein